MAPRFSALFVEEGALGADVMGHLRAAENLGSQLPGRDVDARVVQLPPLTGLSALAVRTVPLADRLDLDLQAVRWHLVQALRARSAIDAALEHGRPDVVHVHTHTLALLSMGRFAGIPTFVSVDSPVWDWHAMSIWRPTRPYSRALLGPSIRLERRVFSAAARVLALTPWARRAVERACPDARVIEHHPGLDLTRFRPRPRSERQRTRLLFVGARFAAKGGRDLLEAIEPLRDQVELDVVTPLETFSEPHVRVHRLSPDDPRLPELYAETDVFCLPTYGDTSPWVVLEAMASGAAVVTSDVGGTPDLLDSGRVGLVVPRGDVAGLRAAISELVANPARRAELGAAARAHCERHYDAQVQTDKLFALLQEAIPRRTP